MKSYRFDRELCLVAEEVYLFLEAMNGPFLAVLFAPRALVKR